MRWYWMLRSSTDLLIFGGGDERGEVVVEKKEASVDASVYVFCILVLEESETCLFWYLWRIALESSGTNNKVYLFPLFIYNSYRDCGLRGDLSSDTNPFRSFNSSTITRSSSTSSFNTRFSSPSFAFASINTVFSFENVAISCANGIRGLSICFI